MRAIRLRDDRTVLVDDTGGGRAGTVVWHHESPHTGALYEPLLGVARARDLRLLAVTRPGYGGTDPRPGRTVADGARDLEQVLDALGLGTVAVVGGSGGGPHALAAAALLPDRVSAAAVLASPAPFRDTADWWDGMADDGGLRAATRGREARIAWARTAPFDPDQFTDADWTVLEGTWAGLGRDAEAAGTTGLQGGADDDVAFVTPWGVDLGTVRVPVRIDHGDRDRVVPVAQGRMLAEAVPGARYEEHDGDGHLSVLAALPEVVDWLVAAAPE